MAQESKTEVKKVARYTEGIGRRKTAVARVRLFSGNGDFTVNGKTLASYFQTESLAAKALAPLTSLKTSEKYCATVHLKGGGIHAQAGAAAHGLARALVLLNPELKKRLAMDGFLKRDSRMVERKKYGLKKARRAPQWAKR